MDHNSIKDSTVNNTNNRVINSGNTNTNSNNIDISGNTINYNIIAATVALNAGNNANGARDIVSLSSLDFRLVVKLPFLRNPNFCGRQDILENLCQILEPYELDQHPPNTLKSSSERKMAVLHGMGGTGKSQIALEYAHRFVHCYTAILWIDSDAKDLTRTTESACKFIEQLVAHYVSSSGSEPNYQAISNILGIPGKIDTSGRIIKAATELAIGAVHSWLAAEKNRGWLLIVDNHDKAEVEELEKLIPTCDWGSVLVTSRIPDLDRFGEVVEVGEIGAGAGLELLLKSSGKDKKPLKDSELEKAKEIVKALGELPLALDQAGAYIKFLRILFSNYRERLDKGMKASFKRGVQGFGLPPDKASVLTTWMLSLEELSEDAKKLIYLCAFLSNEDIPEELFRRGSSAVDWIKAMKDEDRFEDAIGELFAFSLAKRKNSDDDSFWIHPLVQAWAREHIDSTKQLQTVEDTITLVGSAINGETSDERSPDDWIFERRIFSHLRVCQDNITKYFRGLENEKISSASMSIGLTYTELGYYKQAEASYLIALAAREKTLGKDHLSTLNTVDNLASVFDHQGRYNEALDLYQRALAGYEKSLGKDDPSTLATVNNMAMVFDNQGRYSEALELYERALAGCEKVLGKDDELTLDTMHNMAMVFDNLGWYNKAIELYERVLAGSEKTLGKDHPSTLDTVDCMASVFDNQGRYDEALELYQRTLAGYEKILGKDHPSTLGTVNNIAMVFDNQERYEEALELHQRALAGRERSLGKDHPSTLDTVNNMAMVFDSLERYDEALDLHQRALTGREKVLGKDHPSTLDSLHNIAMVFDGQARYNEALELFQKALAGYEKSLGKDHPTTLETIDSIATVFNNQGRFNEALELYQRALVGLEKALGKSHPSTLDTVNNMAEVFDNLGQFDEAL
ncbi:hypothetical protein RUND412_000519, partial [Rhizina undulata]